MSLQDFFPSLHIIGLPTFLSVLNRKVKSLPVFRLQAVFGPKFFFSQFFPPPAEDTVIIPVMC